MHELGHNLGLRHGGPNNVTDMVYKPNHLSVMNYLYMNNGDGLTVDGKTGFLDYSIFNFYSLDENSLSENDGIQLPNDVEPYSTPLGDDDSGKDYSVLYFKNGTDCKHSVNNRCLVSGKLIGESIDWNNNGIIENGRVSSDISWSGRTSPGSAAYYGQGRNLLEVKSEWDNMDFRFGDIGQEMSVVSTKNYDKRTSNICSLSSLYRFYSPYSYSILPYNMLSSRIETPAGKRIVLGAIIMNSGLEDDTYELVIETDNDWNIQFEKDLIVKSGHKKAVQFFVDIPNSTPPSHEERLHVFVNSIGNECLSEGTTYYISILDQSFEDDDEDNIPNQIEIAEGLDPQNPDTDGDGIFDGVELTDIDSPEDVDGDGIMDALDEDNIEPVDSDDDGLSDNIEVSLGLDPNNPDSDSDGINDGLETGSAREDTPPVDFDNDGIIDAIEPESQAFNNNDTDDDEDSYTENEGDCDDFNSEIYPGASEIPNNSIDEDCDGEDLVDLTLLDQDEDGVTPADGDCNDENDAIFPGAEESCGDDTDNNCDGQIDEGCEPAPGDLNGDGCVDRADYSIIMADIRGGAPFDMAHDLNGDGAVNIADGRFLVTLFTNPRGVACP